MIKQLYKLVSNIHDNFLEERAQWILWVPIFYSLGILIYFFLKKEPNIIYILSIISTLLIVLYFKRTLLIITLIIISLGFAAINIRSCLLYVPKLTEEIKYATIIGKIEAITVLPVGDRIILKSTEIRKNSFKLSLPKVRLVVKTGLNKAKIGDVVIIKANIMPPPESVVAEGYDFARSSYFEQIGAVGYNIAPIKVLKKNQGNILTNYIANLRKNIEKQVIKLLGKDIGGVATALMIGEYNLINRTILNNMRIAGVSHILSVSGMHLSLAAAIFFYTVRLLLNLFYPIFYRANIKKIAAFMALLGSFGYLLISGMQVAAVRSFIMTSMIIIAVMLDRTANPARSLAFAAIIILIFRPEVVVNPSFQMSFMAVLALISCYSLYKKYLSPKVQSWSLVTKFFFYILSTAFSSLIAGLATAPFVIYHFNQYSNYSVIANVIAVPITSFLVMPCVVLSFILYPFHLMSVALVPMGYGIKMFIAISNLIAEWPYSVKPIHFMSNFTLFIMTSGMLILYICKTKLRFAGMLLMVIAGIMTYTQLMPDLIINSKDNTFLINNKNAVILSSKQIPKYTREAWLHYLGKKDFAWLDLKHSSNIIDCKNDFECRYNKGNYDLIFTKHSIDIVNNSTKKILQHLKITSQLGDIYMVYLDKLKIVSLQQLRGDRLWTIN